MENPIAVVGGTGRIGRLVVQGLLERGERVRVVSRHGRQHGAAIPARTVHQADVRDVGSLVGPLSGCSAIVYSVEPGTADSGPNSPKATMYTGVLNALQVAADGGTNPQFVMVSQIYVTRKDHPINRMGGMLDWRLAGEDAIRESGLPYTIVRPSWLTNGSGQRLRLEQGDTGDGQITRQDVADACVEALYDPVARGLTFEMYNEPGRETADWGKLFSSLVPDPAPQARPRA
jgi:uncharacterized protein YbjT (DUF2867 family)